MYDIIYVKSQNGDSINLEKIKKRFPLIKTIDYSENAYEVYQRAQKKSMSKMFWLINDDNNILDNFNFSYQVPQWDEIYIHIFRYDVYLIPKKYKFTDEEINRHIFLFKKNIDIEASIPAPYDAFFISYNESNAEENFEIARLKIPSLQRIQGVKGIHQAHIAAALKSNTKMFWAIDGDAKIIDTFNFDYRAEDYNAVHVWRSQNPINGLIYGYGGVKLLPKMPTINMDTSRVDMSTSISGSFKLVEEVSNITAFNTDTFSTWRSAFRECVKLSSRIIDGQVDIETENRLEIWCTIGQNQDYGHWALMGAQAGRKYGYESKNNSELLSKINDWEWLENEFRKS